MAGRASDKDLEILQILATIAHLVHILACMKQQIFNLFKKAGTRFIRDCTRLRYQKTSADRANCGGWSRFNGSTPVLTFHSHKRGKTFQYASGVNGGVSL